MQKILNNMNTTKSMPEYNEMTFRQVNRLWIRVDSRDKNPLTFADICKQLNVEFTENCYFARYKNHFEKTEQDIVIRQYGGVIKINITNYYEQ